MHINSLTSEQQQIRVTEGVGSGTGPPAYAVVPSAVN